MTMFVLPTSIANNIGLRKRPLQLAGDHALDAVAGANQQRPVIIDAGGDAAVTIPLDVRPMRRGCGVAPRLENITGAFGENGQAVAERDQHVREDAPAIDGASE